MPIPKYYVRPDGLHESIITVNGKRKAFRGKTDREVWNKIKAYRAEAEKPKTVPFSDVAHAWWNEIEPTLAPNSLRNYSPAYERAVAQFGPEDVATITSKEVETYINQFAKTHAKKTVITQRQIIRQILNKAQREGYVSFNAAHAVLLPKNLPQKRRHAPPADQIQKIKDNPKVVGIFGYSYLEENLDKVQDLPMNGVPATYENIASFKYPGARPLYVYVKKAHMRAIPGLQDFMKEWAKSWGKDGPLVKVGMVAMPDDVAAANALKVQNLPVELFLRGENLTNDKGRDHVSFIKDIAPLPGANVVAGLRFTF